MVMRFEYEKLPEDVKRELEMKAKFARADILKMTNIAKSGHPGGSLSSIEIFLTVYTFANFDPKNPDDPNRDRFVISHGHTSPGVYSALIQVGALDRDEVLTSFRHASSIYEGHVTRGLPGIDWTTGNLGQGLSAGLGMALATRYNGKNYHVFVMMSDAEQNKGQVAEARRMAVKYCVDNLTVVIDYNDAQISGKASNIMKVNIKEEYEAAGWKIYEADGHDFDSLYSAIKTAVEDGKPSVVIAHTKIGKGISFMEDEVKYHGKTLSDEELKKALEELGVEDDTEIYKERRKKLPVAKPKRVKKEYKISIDIGKPFVYEKEMDGRGAVGKAILDLVKRNPDVPIVAVDCDLLESVRFNWLSEEFPDRIIEAGVAEQNAATVAGSMSAEGVITFFGDFGVFAVDETFNNQRLNAMNHTNLKIIATHCGTNVGEDGKTHHALFYATGPANWFGFEVIVPSDANQADIAVRYAASKYGNFLIAVGRSKLPVVKREDGSIFYDSDYALDCRKVDVIRKGKSDKVVISMGSTVPFAVEAADETGSSMIAIPCPLSFEVEGIKELLEGKKILVVEDHSWLGLGAILSYKMMKAGIKPEKFEHVAISDFTESGSWKDIYKLHGFTPEEIAERLKNL
jgi:transketolase